MSTTNDEQGKYGEQPKREPLMSDDEIHDMWWFGESSDVKNRPEVPEGERLLVDDGYEWGAKDVRDFYEAKIASGELMTREEHERILASQDGWVPKRAMQCEAIAHCPGCGAKIIE